MLDFQSIVKRVFFYGIIGFMSQNTERVSDLGNFANFLNLLPLLPQKCLFLLKN